MTRARDLIRTEIGRLNGSQVTLECVLEAETPESLSCRIDQQVDFVVGELRHTIDRLIRAKTADMTDRILAKPPVWAEIPDNPDHLTDAEMAAIKSRTPARVDIRKAA